MGAAGAKMDFIHKNRLRGIAITNFPDTTGAITPLVVSCDGGHIQSWRFARPDTTEDQQDGKTSHTIRYIPLKAEDSFSDLDHTELILKPYDSIIVEDCEAKQLSFSSDGEYLFGVLYNKKLKCNLIYIWLTSTDFRKYCQPIRPPNKDMINCYKHVEDKNLDYLLIGTTRNLGIYDLVSKSMILQIPTQSVTCIDVSLSDDYIYITSGHVNGKLTLWSCKKDDVELIERKSHIRVKEDSKYKVDKVILLRDTRKNDDLDNFKAVTLICATPLYF
eukprot:UN25782